MQAIITLKWVTKEGARELNRGLGCSLLKSFYPQLQGAVGQEKAVVIAVDQFLVQ
jgi:hypothetical protein